MGNITEAEYLTWYSPHQAVDVLTGVGFNPITVHSALLYRITADELRAVAAKRIVTGGGRTSTDYYALLPWNLWTASAIRPVFWDSGDVMLRPETSARVPEFVHACTGVRFDPAGVEKLADQRRPPASDTRSAYQRSADAFTGALSNLADIAERVPHVLGGASSGTTSEVVTAEEAWAWFNSLPQEDQQRPWRWLWPEVRKAFEPRKVLKKHALEFVEGRQRGRRPKAAS